MRILIEGQKYKVKDLDVVFDDPKFYTQKDDFAIINSVGYYHSYKKNELVYMLPKVFMSDENGEKTIFKKNDDSSISINELLELDHLSNSVKHGTDSKWIRQISVSFYKSLVEFKARHKETTIINPDAVSELNTNIGEEEYSYLDLLLSFVNFYKKNKNTILYRHIEHISSQAKKTKWEKTIRKSLPIIDKNNSPIYLELRNVKKRVNTEEELICYFYSILNHFNEEHNLNLKIDASYNILKGYAFEKLQSNGISKLKKINVNTALK